MLYALYKCIDVREIQKGKSMKRKKSTQLLAVALTAAMPHARGSGGAGALRHEARGHERRVPL